MLEFCFFTDLQVSNILIFIAFCFCRYSVLLYSLLSRQSVEIFSLTSISFLQFSVAKLICPLKFSREPSGVFDNIIFVVNFPLFDVSFVYLSEQVPLLSYLHIVFVSFLCSSTHSLVDLNDGNCNTNFVMISALYTRLRLYTSSFRL